MNLDRPNPVWLEGRAPPPSLHAAEPLWKRAPTHDEHGRPLADFMLLIPGLKKRPQAYVERTVAKLQGVFAAYGDAVVFADLNVRINTLWVTVRPAPGLCLEMAAAVKLRVPEALLVAQRTDFSE